MADFAKKDPAEVSRLPGVTDDMATMLMSMWQLAVLVRSVANESQEDRKVSRLL